MLSMEPKNLLTYYANLANQHRNKVGFFIVAYVALVQFILLYLSKSNEIVKSLLEPHKVFMQIGIVYGFIASLTVVVLGIVQHFYNYLIYSWHIKREILNKINNNFKIKIPLSALPTGTSIIIGVIALLTIHFAVIGLGFINVIGLIEKKIILHIALLNIFAILSFSFQMAIIIKYLPIIHVLISEINKEEINKKENNKEENNKDRLLWWLKAGFLILPIIISIIAILFYNYKMININNLFEDHKGLVATIALLFIATEFFYYNISFTSRAMTIKMIKNIKIWKHHIFSIGAVCFGIIVTSIFIIDSDKNTFTLLCILCFVALISLYGLITLLNKEIREIPTQIFKKQEKDNN